MNKKYIIKESKVFDWDMKVFNNQVKIPPEKEKTARISQFQTVLLSYQCFIYTLMNNLYFNYPSSY